MSSKRAYVFHKKFNWKEINNLFCYDVKFPDRLTKRQQILRLYKNSVRKLYEEEMFDFKGADIHSYAAKKRKVREDFEKLKNSNDEKFVNDTLEKYEFFIERRFSVTPLFYDNVAYEWRHAKGLPIFTSEDCEADLWGYYDKRLLDSAYGKPLEWQYREGYPYEDNIPGMPDTTSEGWENVDNNYNNPLNNTKSPEDFQKDIESLKQKYVKPNLWENRK